MTCQRCGHSRQAHKDSGYPRHALYCDQFTCCDRTPTQGGGEHDFVIHEQRRCDCTGYVAEIVPAGPEPAATLALCKWLKDRIKEWEEAAKAELGLLPGERAAATIGGKVLAFITLTQGRKTAKVVNEMALLDFVQRFYPGEVVPQVNPAFRDKLVKDVQRLGALVDPDGEVHDGVIEMTAGAPYPMTKLVDDADQAMADLLAAGRLGPNGLTAIEGNS